MFYLLKTYGNPEPIYPPASYSFDWQVRDAPSKNDYGHTESRNDQQTQGSYHVALPDGRIQVINSISYPLKTFFPTLKTLRL